MNATRKFWLTLSSSRRITKLVGSDLDSHWSKGDNLMSINQRLVYVKYKWNPLIKVLSILLWYLACWSISWRQYSGGWGEPESISTLYKPNSKHMKDGGVRGFPCRAESGIWSSLQAHLFVNSLKSHSTFHEFSFSEMQTNNLHKKHPGVPWGLCPTRFLLIIFSRYHRQQWHLFQEISSAAYQDLLFTGVSSFCVKTNGLTPFLRVYIQLCIGNHLC